MAPTGAERGDRAQHRGDTSLHVAGATAPERSVRVPVRRTGSRPATSSSGPVGTTSTWPLKISAGWVVASRGAAGWQYADASPRPIARHLHAREVGIIGELGHVDRPVVDLEADLDHSFGAPRLRVVLPFGAVHARDRHERGEIGQDRVVVDRREHPALFRCQCHTARLP